MNLRKHGIASALADVFASIEYTKDTYPHWCILWAPSRERLAGARRAPLRGDFPGRR